MTEVTSTQTKPDTEIGYLLDTVKFLERIMTTVLWSTQRAQIFPESALCASSGVTNSTLQAFSSPHVGCNGHQPPNKTALLLTFFTVASRGLASLIPQLLTV